MSAEPEPPSAGLLVGNTAASSAAASLSISATGALTSLPGLTVMIDGSDLSDIGIKTLNMAFVGGLCSAALRAQTLVDVHAVEQLELSVQLLDEQQIQALNSEYRGKDSPTNVLSFESGMPILPGGALCVLGDLVLCPAVIAREAKDQSKPLLDHWAHMVVHGTLHLCGLDHEKLLEAEAMESLEIQILSDIGIPNPYKESLTSTVNNPIVDDNE